MAETKTDPQPTTEPAIGDPSFIWHIFCLICWPEPVPGQIAICGSPRPPTPARPIWDRPETVCVVCDEIKWKPCPRCGS